MSNGNKSHIESQGKTDSPRYFTVRDLARRWNVSDLFIYRRLDRGEIAALKLPASRTWRIPFSTIERIENEAEPCSA